MDNGLFEPRLFELYGLYELYADDHFLSLLHKVNGLYELYGSFEQKFDSQKVQIIRCPLYQLFSFSHSVKIKEGISNIDHFT